MQSLLFVILRYIFIMLTGFTENHVILVKKTNKQTYHCRLLCLPLKSFRTCSQNGNTDMVSGLTIGGLWVPSKVSKDCVSFWSLHQSSWNQLRVRRGFHFQYMLSDVGIICLNVNVYCNVTLE